MAVSARAVLDTPALAPRTTKSTMGLFVNTQRYGDGRSERYGRVVTAALTLVCTRFNISTSPNRISSLALDHLTDSGGAYLSM